MYIHRELVGWFWFWLWWNGRLLARSLACLSVWWLGTMVARLFGCLLGLLLRFLLVRSLSCLLASLLGEFPCEGSIGKAACHAARIGALI